MDKTGGPAFPLTLDAIAHETKEFAMQGMTLRDYFAAAALQGHFASGTTCTIETRAQIAYKVADAMIAERAK
jgi:hypothetical protein